MAEAYIKASDVLAELNDVVTKYERVLAKRDQLQAAVDAAHANITACLDPKIGGHHGLLMNTEAILRSVASQEEQAS